MSLDTGHLVKLHTAAHFVVANLRMAIFSGHVCHARKICYHNNQRAMNSTTVESPLGRISPGTDAEERTAAGDCTTVAVEQLDSWAVGHDTGPSVPCNSFP